jgi:EAL and modified HD-GYP domain-containing signal transduction protein
MENPDSERKGLPLSIARQPVFDRKGRLWGYEVFFIGSSASECPAVPDSSDIIAAIASSAYIGQQKTPQGEKKILADYSEKSIMDRLPYALSADLAVVKICEQEAQKHTVLEMLGELKADGYCIAVRGFTGSIMHEPLYQMADIIAIEIGNRDKDAIGRYLSAAGKYDALSFASNVPDRRQYESCRELGFSLFHGAFFKSPETVKVRKLSSNEVLRFKLLQYIEREDPDIEKLAETIQSDATISFRLLAYLNSAAFAFSRKIQSIQQAIALLGWERIKNWMRVLLLTDMSPSKDAQELVLLSAQRGKFLELLALEYDYWGFDPKSLHLLGLFSLMDALLHLPMTEIVAALPIDNKMKSALCREQNNEYLPLLRLAQHLEETDWTEAEKMIQQLNLDRKKVMAAFQNSIDWAGDLNSVYSGDSRGAG